MIKVIFNFLKPLMAVGLPLMKMVLAPLAKNALIALGLTAVTLAIDAAIPKKMYGLDTKTLVFSNENLNIK